MLRKSNKGSPQVDNTVAKGVNFEISVADLARRSEKRAWTVATCSLIVSLILIGGYFYMLPLKKIEPYIVLADAYTGNATVTKLRPDLDYASMSTNDAITRSNIARYVVARESFDAAIWMKYSWEVVQVMSTKDLAMSFRDFHGDSNPKQPYKEYGETKALRIEVFAITFNQTGKDLYATVRFQRSVYDKKGGIPPQIKDNKIATVKYTYNQALTMSDSQRYINPLGFQVLEYTVDNDGSPGQPVIASPSTALPAPQPAVTPVAGQPMPGQPYQGQPIQGQPYPGQPVQGQPVQGQPVQGQPVQGQPVQGQPVQGQPVQGQPFQGQPAVPGAANQPYQGPPPAQFGAPAGSQPAANPQQPMAQPQQQPMPQPGVAPAQANGVRR